MGNAASNTHLDQQTRKNLRQWMNGDYDDETKDKIAMMLSGDPKEIINAFYKTLTFGTGGLRGIMGVGSNRMNDYTVRGATQGLANYIHKVIGKDGKASVLIGYDSRHNSKRFAEEASKVLAANGIGAYLFKELRPVPLVSFGCRLKKCIAAIMITASHNPPEYNGYKVYWDDGGQVLPPHDQGIISEVEKITDLSQIKTTLLTNPLVTMIGQGIDEGYLQAIDPLQHYQEINQKEGGNLKIIYTSLHGAGVTMVPKALERWGFTNLHIVEKQREPDGDFPSVHSPNPEERSTLKIGIETLNSLEGDILLATDPDVDRVGIAVRHHGNVVLLTGNQLACLFLNHVLSALKTQERLPEKPAVAKTIVTSELFKVLANRYKIRCANVLTGFKYIAEQIRRWEEDGIQFLFGGEESYGYLLGTHARDKDAVISCALACEIALKGKIEGKTLVDLLYELYKDNGIFREQLMTLKFEESREGKEEMNNAMKALRENPPKSILGTKILSVEDYFTSTKTDLVTGESAPLTLPKSNVLLFWLEDQTKLVVRPSGTEPKVKLYCGVQSQKTEDVPLAIEHCDTLAKDYLTTLKSMISED